MPPKSARARSLLSDLAKITKGPRAKQVEEEILPTEEELEVEREMAVEHTNDDDEEPEETDRGGADDEDARSVHSTPPLGQEDHNGNATMVDVEDEDDLSALIPPESAGFVRPSLDAHGKRKRVSPDPQQDKQTASTGHDPDDDMRGENGFITPRPRKKVKAPTPSPEAPGSGENAASKAMLDQYAAMMKQMQENMESLKQQLAEAKKVEPAVAPVVASATITTTVATVSQPPPLEPAAATTTATTTVKTEAPIETAKVEPQSTTTQAAVKKEEPAVLKFLDREEALERFEDFIPTEIDKVQAKSAATIERIQKLAKRQLDRVPAASPESVKEAIKKKETADIDAENAKCQALVDALDASMNSSAAVEKFYFDTNKWAHPDEQMKLWCRKQDNGLWWEDQDLSKYNLTLKKDGSNVYPEVKCPDVAQKFNGNVCRNATIILSAAAVRYVNLYPHGNKDHPIIKPKHVFEVRYSLELTRRNFLSRFVVKDKDNKTNIQRCFDWVSGDFTRWVGKAIYNTEGAANDVKGKFKASLTEAQRDNGAFCREEFVKTKVKGPVTIDKNGEHVIRLSTPLFHKEFDQEADKHADTPYVAKTQYAHDVYYHPQKIPKDGTEDNAFVGKRLQREYYDRQVMNDLPLLSVRTFAEYVALKNKDPEMAVQFLHLQPFAQRHLADDDVVWAVVSPSVYSQNADKTYTGSNGFDLVALIYCGHSHEMNETIQELPVKCDQTQFCVAAMPYPHIFGLPPDKRQPDMKPPEKPEVDYNARQPIAKQEKAARAAKKKTEKSKKTDA